MIWVVLIVLCVVICSTVESCHKNNLEHKNERKDELILALKNEVEFLKMKSQTDSESRKTTSDLVQQYIDSLKSELKQLNDFKARLHVYKGCDLKIYNVDGSGSSKSYDDFIKELEEDCGL